MNARIVAASDAVYQIALTPPLEGFSDFISAWLVKGPPVFLVDVGPSSTADQLIAALEQLGVSHLDYILLTHLHLDHAGAAGRLSRRYPAATVVCHEKGLPHLADPGRLWEATRSVLGPLALGYGPPEPVAAERCVRAQGFAVAGITAVPTPGHAPHHVSFAAEGCLFAGEACGVWYRFGDGREYMRPATPPVFFMDLALRSIEALIAHAPSRMVVAHTGMTENGTELLRRHRGQLLFWEKWLGGRAGGETGEAAVQRCMEGLLAEDPLLANFAGFAPPAAQREKYFLGNSLNGFLGWLGNPEHGGRRTE
jgi:glyoxylase-like metal-dependent hydrolase (beta-lactamase superfamily II)